MEFIFILIILSGIYKAAVSWWSTGFFAKFVIILALISVAYLLVRWIIKSIDRWKRKSNGEWLPDGEFTSYLIFKTLAISIVVFIILFIILSIALNGY